MTRWKPDNAPPQSIELNIESLVVTGMSVNAAHRMSQALQHELTSLLTDGGISETIAIANLTITSDIAPTSDASPEAIGMQIARAIYKRIGA